MSSVLGVGSTFQRGLLFLVKLAWDSRFRLPILITVGFMVLDVRMQLEINIDIDQRNLQQGEDDDNEEEDDLSDVSGSDYEFDETSEEIADLILETEGEEEIEHSKDRDR